MILVALFLALVKVIRDWIHQNLHKREVENVSTLMEDVENLKVVREENKKVGNVGNIGVEEGENIKQFIEKVYKSIKRQ